MASSIIEELMLDVIKNIVVESLRFQCRSLLYVVNA
jgi:hypothetical protein